MKKMMISLRFLLVLLCVQGGLFAASPVITDIQPSSTLSTGGAMVQIEGTGFTGAFQVKFNSANSPVFAVLSDTVIRAQVPAGTVGNYQVTVFTPSGTSVSNSESVLTLTGPHSLLVVNQTAQTLALIKNDVLITEIPLVSSNNTGLAVTPDGKFALVVDSVTNQMFQVSLTTNTVVQTVTMPLGMTTAEDVAISSDGSYAWVAGTGGVARFTLPNLTISTFLPIATPSIPSRLVISPDGTNLYVASRAVSQTLFNINLNTLGVLSLALSSDPSDILITPDGSTVFVTTTTPLQQIRKYSTSPFSLVSFFNTVTPVGMSISPNGQDLFYAASTGGVGFIAHLNAPSFTNVGNIAMPVNSNPANVAVSADGTKVYVVLSGTSTISLNTVMVIDVATNTLQNSPVIPVDNGFTTDQRGMTFVPDQSPVAHISQFSNGSVGQPIALSASDSVSPTGTIALYTWDFGDSTSVVSAMPNMSHTYAAPGIYNLTLTVQNSFGNSGNNVFSGNTNIWSGSPLATVVQQIIVSNPIPNPPTGFTGTVTKEVFLTQAVGTNRLMWTASTDPSVVEYLLFRNGVLIANIPASGPFVYNDSGRSLGVTTVYSLETVNNFGNVSAPVFVTLTN